MATMNMTGLMTPMYILGLYILLLSVGSTEAHGECHFTCPRPGEPEHYTVCCSNTKNGYTEAYCCSAYMLAGILGGVFGALLLTGVIIAIVCCWLVKSGRYKCVKYQTMHRRGYRLQKCTPAERNQIQTGDQNTQSNNPVPLHSIHNSPFQYQTQYGLDSHGFTPNQDPPPSYDTATMQPKPQQEKQDDKLQRF